VQALPLELAQSILDETADALAEQARIDAAFSQMMGASASPDALEGDLEAELAQLTAAADAREGAQPAAAAAPAAATARRKAPQPHGELPLPAAGGGALEFPAVPTALPAAAVSVEDGAAAASKRQRVALSA